MAKFTVERRQLKLIEPLSLEDPLREEIEKWEFILEYVDTHQEYVEEGGYNTCALCQYYRRSVNDPCDGCPVKVKTGHDFCEGTPYRHYLDAKMLYIKMLAVGEAKEKAQEMLAFLKDIRREYHGSVQNCQ